MANKIHLDNLKETEMQEFNEALESIQMSGRIEQPTFVNKVRWFVNWLKD